MSYYIQWKRRQNTKGNLTDFPLTINLPKLFQTPPLSLQMRLLCSESHMLKMLFSQKKVCAIDIKILQQFIFHIQAI